MSATQRAIQKLTLYAEQWEIAAAEPVHCAVDAVVHESAVQVARAYRKAIEIVEQEAGR